MSFAGPGLRSSLFAIIILLACAAYGQEPASRARITAPIDDAQRVTLRGNTHPLAKPQYDRGAAPDELPARRMMLVLGRSADQEAALEKFLEEQQTPGSPNFRHWLTPAEFGRRFGAVDADVQAVTNWLQRQGFVVDRIAQGRTALEFSGSAGQVRQAFHATIHKYVVNGEARWANAQDPEVPAALSAVVQGIVSLNNFPRKPMARQIGVFSRAPNGAVQPEYTVSNSSGSYYALAPADFATIYNTKPLLQAGNNGAGQTIAVLGESNVNLKDVSDFRSLFGLGAGNTSVILDGPDPGIVAGDEGESLLDLEWANAVAPGAAVVLVSAEDTETTSGIDLAALHAVEHDVAGVISVSYGNCEARVGDAELQFIRSLWQQASAQGITVLVSSGDDGSAGCDNQNTRIVAKSGLGVNGLASTAYNVAVGGTDFDDATSQTTYWNSTNDSTTRASAKSYIPESTWNGTCAATATATNLNVCPEVPTTGTPPASLNLWSGSGGASPQPKPAWQTGAGVPNDGMRDLPDVSLFAAAGTSSKSFYVVCQADALPSYAVSCNPQYGTVYFVGSGGTSASAPSFAGIVALAAQKAGTRLGNINPLLYSLAARAGSSCTSAAAPGASCIFNDVVKGNISVPCQAGSPNCSLSSGTGTGVMVDSSQSPAYAASAGYDLATGLGSVNAANLVSGIANAVSGFASTTTALTLNGGTGALTLQHGDPVTVGVSVTPSASVGTVSLLGNAGGFDSQSLTSGAASWTSKLFPGGTYAVKAHYPGDGAHGASDSNTISVTVNPETSQSFVNFVTWTSAGVLQSFTGNSVPYGSPYVLRVDVTDSAGTISPTQGVTSKCSAGNASCPTGTVTVKANGAPLDGGSFALNSQGFTEDQPIQLPAGTYTIASSYPGDASYGASTASGAFSVTKAPTTATATTTQTSFQYGTPSQFTVAVKTGSSGVAPTGTVTFTDNGAPAGTSIRYVYMSSTQAGTGSVTAGSTYIATYAPPSLGAHSLSAQYPGDSNYASSASPGLSFDVSKARTNPSSNSVAPTTATPNVPVTIASYVTTSSQMAAPTGTITFFDNGTAIPGTVAYSGNDGTTWSTASLRGQLTTNFTQLGTHSITMTYSGDDRYATSASANLGNVNVYDKLPTQLNGAVDMFPALTNYPNTFTVYVGSQTAYNGGPGGTVSLFDNGQPISATVTYAHPYQNQLTATVSYSFPTSGSHNITATYSGDANYASGTMNAYAVTVYDKLPTTIPYLNGNSTAVNQATSLSANINSDVIYKGPVMGGTVTFLDNGAPMAGTVQLTPFSGYLISNLTYTFTTVGAHNVTVQYSGDDHYAAVSKVFPVTVLGPLAIQLQSTGYNIGATGGTITPSFAVTNNTSSPMTVALACKPDSAAATCTLNPSTVTIAAYGWNYPTVTITVPALNAGMRRTNPFTTTLILAGLLAGLPFTRRKKRILVVTLIVIALALIMVACGGGGGTTGGSPSTGGTGSTVATSKKYTFTVTATSGANTDSQVITVTVSN